jgi:uncharacterized protein (TIGR04255 family)
MAYPRPPIVEAAIEFKFDQSVDDEALGKVAGKFRPDYPNVHDESQVAFQFSPDGMKQIPSFRGKRLSSHDQANIIIVRTNAYGCMRLAPYCGWDEFVKMAQYGWAVVTRSIGRRPVQRVGVRYVNRLDIPSEGVVNEDEYLRFYPKAPDLDWGPMSNYVLQMSRPLNADGCSVNVNSGPTPPPLLAHQSVLLDIDVYAAGLELRRDDELWDLVAKIRQHKNRIFESCITDKARALFNG